MHTGLVFAAITVIATWIMYQYIRWRQLKTKGLAHLPAGPEKNVSAEWVKDEYCWASLETAAQLELATALASKALPVWKNYAETHDLTYRNSPLGTTMHIPATLLHTSLEAISQASKIAFAKKDKDLHVCYNEFVAPLIALQDGNWILPYPVKKIFLSVYNLLTAMTERDHAGPSKTLIELSIVQSLDCLDMSKLYSSSEVNAFLQSYASVVEK